ncbi:hypothetical protein CERZMDRAFT_88444 [Cercospora zeae-maydis SCOH1-5]|uniref:RlpA-like protein double-psi beta-barrel domain-containing protein n=1 Tax=Cercospora zeae-maydis SCOH1-5 TaxID=717836 RepID=A0A6A6F0X3_9PEZI|nr:hypothetical protein CERZMDRAFT_88444 [Cercospora zeae-maydis SCOH1-5]
MNFTHLLAMLGLAAAAKPTTFDRNPLLRIRRSASHEGDMTWKEGDFSGNACGLPPSSSSPAVALNAPTFDASTPGGNPNANTLCGQKIRIWNLESGAEAFATVVDRMAVQDGDAIDVSREVFAALGVDEGVGRCRVGWSL